MLFLFRAMTRKLCPESKATVLVSFLILCFESRVSFNSFFIIALKKKNSKSRYFKGSGCSLKIFTALNGMTKGEILENCEHVGIVQTAINPVGYILVFMVLKVGHIFYWLTHFIFFFRTIKRNPLDSAPTLPGIFLPFESLILYTPSHN